MPRGKIFFKVFSFRLTDKHGKSRVAEKLIQGAIHKTDFL
jgi:hypothetical protein